MERSDLGKLFKTNPLLAMQVASFGQDKLNAIEVLTPGTMPEKYRQFCDKLKLDKPPALVICPAEFHGKLHGHQQSIFYTMFSNSVWMPRPVLEAFVNNESKANYATAHELGHASGRMNRRNFLKSFGAATLGGLAVGTGSYAVLESATKNPETAKKMGDRKAANIFNGMVGTTAGFATTHALLKTLLPALREEEFSADDYAKQVLGLAGILEPLTERALAECKRKGRTDIVERVKEFEAGIATNTSPEQKLLAALETIRLLDENKPLSQMVDKNTYPDFAARLRRHEGEIRSTLNVER